MIHLLITVHYVKKVLQKKCGYCRNKDGETLIVETNTYDIKNTNYKWSYESDQSGSFTPITNMNQNMNQNKFSYYF